MEILTLTDGYENREVSQYRYLTPDEALKLTYRETVYFRAIDGTAKRCRVSGKVRTWKRNAARIELPVKFGLYQSATMVARNGRMEEWGGSGAVLLVKVG